jgi:TIR domain/TPR repeat
MKPSHAEAPDVFVSYARKNRSVAEQLAEGLSASGLQVWWDSDLTAGSEFAAVIEAKLLGAAVVVVMWSADSVRSPFVRDESSRALKHDKLLPVRIEDIELPLGFGQLHTLDLLDWDGDADAEAFQKLLHEVQRRQQRTPLGLLPPPPPPRPNFKWPRRSTLIASAALALAAAGAVTWYVRDESDRISAEQTEADRHFRAGLDLQYADVPQLEKARNEYLSAIEHRPAHARAHYYLGHVYAQTGNTLDALASFKRALSDAESPLDRSQRAEAEKQLLALATVEGEEAPITRSVGKAEPSTGASAPTSAAPGAVVVAAADPVPRPAPVAVARPAPRPAGDVDTQVVTRSIKAKAPAAAAPPVAIVAAAAPPAPAPAAPRAPARIAPPEANVAPLAKSVEALFDDNKESRIGATTSLVLDPQALSDAIPFAVDKALQVLKTNPACKGAGASGVLGTLVLLQSALPGTLQVNRVAIEQLIAAAEPLGDYTAQQANKVRELLKQAPTHKPVAYIQIANEAQRPIAEALAVKLRAFSYEVPAFELVGARAPEVTQLRVQGKSDRSYARWVRKAVGDAIDAQPLVSALRNAKPGTDTYEIWFGRQLCAPGGRWVAGCKGA